MSLNKSVFEMVHEVLGDAKRKSAEDMASSSSVMKTAAVRPMASRMAGTIPTERLLKLASQLDYVAANLHTVTDTRSPQEKLAEYAAIQKGLMKAAFEVGGQEPKEPTEEQTSGKADEGPHQTQEATSESIPPKTVPLNESGTGVGGDNTIPSAPAMTSGTSMDAGESGEALSANIPDETIVPNEKANPMDAANALETNKDMMHGEQPDDLLKQPGGDESTGSPSIKAASARAVRVLEKLSGRPQRAMKEKVASLKRAHILLNKAKLAGIPQDVAEAMVLSAMPKLAEDAINPAQIEGGTAPILQSDPGTPSQLSQGSEAGVNTPRGSAPTSGEGGGREGVSSNEAAINFTKQDAKRQNRGALAELLSEPMQDSAHEHVLSQSLDNTDSAGVKISAAREMVRKFVESSPRNIQKVARLIKAAQEVAGDISAPAGINPMQDDQVPPEAAGVPMEGLPPEELMAEEEQPTPEDLALAEALLAEGAPEEGDVEKTEQGGMSPMGYGGGGDAGMGGGMGGGAGGGQFGGM